MNTNVRWSLLVLLFASFASVACARDEQNDFAAKVKAKAERTAEWTKEKCAKIKEEFLSSTEQGRVKWQKFTDEARELADTKLGTHFSRKEAKLDDKELIELKVPFEVAEGQKPTGTEPVVRTAAIIKEEVIIGGEKVTMHSTDLPQDADWFAWLDTEEGKMFAVGAIAVITIAGVTYVLYKNRVPQRIYGYAVKNPMKAAVSAACIVGLALYLAKDKICLPNIVQ